MYAPRPVLVVDDTGPFREMISAILVPRGYRVMTAVNGREALSRLRLAAEPHLILLDIVMPVLDGVGVCTEIRMDRELSAAGHRIILMSTSDRLSAPDIPPTEGRLVKPFTRQQLISAVEAVTRMREPI
jgi:CheY-like chemotaxis protein